MQVLEAQPTLVTSRAQEFMTRVYGWMAAGLALTGVVAYLTVSTGLIFSVGRLMLPLFFGLLILAYVLQAKMDRMSTTTAIAGFVVYAALIGVLLSPIFLIYTSTSIAKVFFITAGTFGGMSLYGMVTRSDLSTVGSTCMMGFWGIFIASMVNIFIGSDQMSWIISFVGVFVFTGLAAYKNQELMQMGHAIDPYTDDGKKAAILGGLSLYITFINLFTSLMRLLGDRR